MKHLIKASLAKKRNDLWLRERWEANLLSMLFYPFSLLSAHSSLSGGQTSLSSPQMKKRILVRDKRWLEFLFTKERKDVEKDGRIWEVAKIEGNFNNNPDYFWKTWNSKKLDDGGVRKLSTTKRKLYNEVETKYMIYGCRASLADERENRKSEREREIVTINLAPWKLSRAFKETADSGMKRQCKFAPVAHPQ